MDLQLSEFQELLRSNAEDFLLREVPASRIREIQDAGEPDAKLWAKIVELGWTGLPIAEEHGGQGGSILDLSIVIEQLCRTALLSPFVPTALAALVVQQHGTAEAQRLLLPRIADEGVTVSIALSERHGDLYEAIDATYDATSGGGTVSGEKRFVDYARTTDYHLVAAMRDGTPGLALVPRDDGGVRFVQDLASIGMTPQAVVAYDGATAEAWFEGAEVLETLRQLGATFASLESYAHAQKALDMTVEYVQTRVQFGRPIGSFQAVQMRLADLSTRVEASKFLIRELLWHFDQGTAEAAQVAVVKAITADTVSRVTQDCHLLHGGIGFIIEYDLYFSTIRGKEAALRFGGAREALRGVADSLLA